ncbi:MAG: toll/interleukin-1 receptor domain-containing protein [Clostridia bacterium]|nr:toll/interleukin-1 receptor domain-containing protein [Clostridia bacterium]
MSKNYCNICGSNYEYEAGRWKCPACGVYKEEEFSNEEETLIYNAEQKLRLANFDDAELAFDDIIRKYPKNPAGYWGRLRASYGVKEEVDFDGRKIPTCYATSIESVLDSKDYKKALSLADKETKEYYQKQAEYIERVRVAWVEKASKEEPYDIFISYKDSDTANDIERTKDSYDAQELYIQLIRQGYKVFFSRESLRDKVGEKYEPYIFNALSTAKVMIVYGSSADYINSTWVKNEWSRYLKKISRGERKENSLIVAYDGFNVNDLPKTLSSKQCLDASSRKFYFDLDKSIKKVMEESNKNEQKKNLQNKKEEQVHRHDFKKVNVVEPTCKQGGFTEYRCSCGEMKKTDYTPKRKEHEFGNWEVIRDVTCSSNGIKRHECQICGYDEEEVIECKGHKFSEWQTILNNSKKMERVCSVCGELETKSTADYNKELEKQKKLEQKKKEEQAKELEKQREIKRNKSSENKQEKALKRQKRNKVMKKTSIILLSIISFAFVLVCAVIIKPKLHWDLTELENVKQGWPNLWKGLLVSGVLGGLIWGFTYCLDEDYMDYYYVPKGIVTIFLIYFLVTYENTTKIYNYTTTFRIVGLMSVALSIYYDLNGGFSNLKKSFEECYLDEIFYNDVRQLLLVPFILIFTHSFTFLSAVTVWIMIIVLILYVIYKIGKIFWWWE